MKAKSKPTNANAAAAMQKQLAALQSQISALSKQAKSSPAPKARPATAKPVSSSRVPSDYSPGTRKLALWLSAQKGAVPKERFYQQTCKLLGIRKEQAGCVFAPGSLFHISGDGKLVGLSEPGRRILAKIRK